MFKFTLWHCQCAPGAVLSLRLGLQGPAGLSGSRLGARSSLRLGVRHPSPDLGQSQARVGTRQAYRTFHWQLPDLITMICKPRIGLY